MSRTALNQWVQGSSLGSVTSSLFSQKEKHPALLHPEVLDKRKNAGQLSENSKAQGKLMQNLYFTIRPSRILPSEILALTQT